MLRVFAFIIYICKCLQLVLNWPKYDLDRLTFKCSSNLPETFVNTDTTLYFRLFPRHWRAVLVCACECMCEYWL